MSSGLLTKLEIEGSVSTPWALTDDQGAELAQHGTPQNDQAPSGKPPELIADLGDKAMRGGYAEAAPELLSRSELYIG